MRIIWQNDRFEAELTPGDLWQDDKQSAHKAGFKTDGPPTWTWHTNKASALNKLRENRPKSGIVLTEFALEKYNRLNTKEKEKLELRKKFKKAQTEAAKTQSCNLETYFDTELLIDCIVVKPADKPFVTTFVRPVPPDIECIICGDPLYFYDYPDICLFCDSLQKQLTMK